MQIDAQLRKSFIQGPIVFNLLVIRGYFLRSDHYAGIVDTVKLRRLEDLGNDPGACKLSTLPLELIPLTVRRPRAHCIGHSCQLILQLHTSIIIVALAFTVIFHTLAFTCNSLTLVTRILVEVRLYYVVSYLYVIYIISDRETA